MKLWRCLVLYNPAFREDYYNPVCGFTAKYVDVLQHCKQEHGIEPTNTDMEPVEVPE